MIYLQNCEIHSKLKNKLCRVGDYCQIMCDQCFIVGGQGFNCYTAICLNSQALSYFETLTGYGYYKMFEWIDIVRKNGFFSLFQIGQRNGTLLDSQGIDEQLCLLGIKALQKYQCLTKNNRQFVLDNKNTQNLYHPQFLNDIYNLITQKWQLSSQLILNNLHQQIKQKYSQQTGTDKLPSFRIKQYYLNLIELYRVELLTKIIKKIVCTVDDLKEHDNKNENQKEQVFVNQINQIIDYQLPYSIQQIQSFQEIGERCSRYHRTVISISNQQETHQRSLTISKQLELKEINLIKKEMEKLKLQTFALLQQNKFLQTKNIILQKQKQQLQAKIDRLLQQNKENSETDKNKIQVKASINPTSLIRKIRIIK